MLSVFLFGKGSNVRTLGCYSVRNIPTLSCSPSVRTFQFRPQRLVSRLRPQLRQGGLRADSDAQEGRSRALERFDSLTTAQRTAFNRLKSLISTSPALRQPDMSKPFQIEVDASKMGFGAFLLQEESDGQLAPCGYFSRLPIATEFPFWQRIEGTHARVF